MEAFAKGRNTGTTPLRVAGGGVRPTGRETLAATIAKNIPAFVIVSPRREGGSRET